MQQKAKNIITVTRQTQTRTRHIQTRPNTKIIIIIDEKNTRQDKRQAWAKSRKETQPVISKKVKEHD